MTRPTPAEWNHVQWRYEMAQKRHEARQAFIELATRGGELPVSMLAVATTKPRRTGKRK